VRNTPRGPQLGTHKSKKGRGGISTGPSTVGTQVWFQVETVRVSALFQLGLNSKPFLAKPELVQLASAEVETRGLSYCVQLHIKRRQRRAFLSVKMTTPRMATSGVRSVRCATTSFFPFWYLGSGNHIPDSTVERPGVDASHSVDSSSIKPVSTRCHTSRADCGRCCVGVAPDRSAETQGKR
jgi:hypothetical protein